MRSRVLRSVEEGFVAGGIRFSFRRENYRNTRVFSLWYPKGMKIGVSLPEELVAFADEAASRRGTSRSEFLARLLEAERIRERVEAYIDRHGWDIADDEAAWRRHQKHRMAAEYRDDEW